MYCLLGVSAVLKIRVPHVCWFRFSGSICYPRSLTYPTPFPSLALANIYLFPSSTYRVFIPLLSPVLFWGHFLYTKVYRR